MNKKISPRIAGVYQIYNKITRKSYIGSSTSLIKRLQSHIIYSSNKGVKEDFERLGIESFQIHILEMMTYTLGDSSLKESLLNKEQFYLNDILKANQESDYFLKYAYNEYRDSRSNKGTTISNETRIKLSELHSGKPKPVSDLKITKLAIKENKIIAVHGSIENYKKHLISLQKQKHGYKRKVTTLQGIEIAQFDLQGNFIFKYESPIIASKSVNTTSQNICKAIKFNGVSKGYQWMVYFEGCEKGIGEANKDKFIIYDASFKEIARCKTMIEITKTINVSYPTINLHMSKNEKERDFIFGLYKIERISLLQMG